MTIELLDPNDTGEIPRLPADLGGDPTRNLSEYVMLAPSFRAIPSGDLVPTTELPLYVPGPSVGFDEPVPTERLTILGTLTGPGHPTPDPEPPPPPPSALTSPSGPSVPPASPPTPKPPRPAAPGRYVPFGAMSFREPRGWWARLTYRGQHRAGAR